MLWRRRRITVRWQLQFCSFCGWVETSMNICLWQVCPRLVVIAPFGNNPLWRYPSTASLAFQLVWCRGCGRITLRSGIWMGSSWQLARSMLNGESRWCRQYLVPNAAPYGYQRSLNVLFLRNFEKVYLAELKLQKMFMLLCQLNKCTILQSARPPCSQALLCLDIR